MPNYNLYCVVLALLAGCSCQPPQGADDEVYIPGGAFWMGHDSYPLAPDCIGSTEPCIAPGCVRIANCNSFAPRHLVTLNPYFIDKREVTNGQYQACVAAGFCSFPEGVREHPGTEFTNRYLDAGFADFPFPVVRWKEAQRYCQWRGRRLPTEAEWERAARGTNEREYPWGNTPATCEQLPEACPPRSVTGDDWLRMRAVGTTPDDATPEGILDLAGNAAEMVSDGYDPGYYGASPERNPTGPVAVPQQLQAVARGAWFDAEPPDWARGSTVPMWARAKERGTEGFRCARDLTQARIMPRYQAIAWRRIQ